MEKRTTGRAAREDTPFVFEGFDGPNYTQIPDVFFDEIMPQLTEAELRVCLYVMRRTFGFKKNADDISLRQMTEGITKHDGTVLDRGTGMVKSSVVRGAKGLVEKGILLAQQNESQQHGDLPTTYSLRVKAAPVFRKETPPSSAKRQARVSQRNTQETVRQQTVLQDPPRAPKGAQTAPALPMQTTRRRSADSMPITAPAPRAGRRTAETVQARKDARRQLADQVNAEKFYHGVGAACRNCGAWPCLCTELGKGLVGGGVT